MRKPTIWVPTRFDTNRAVQSQKMGRGWKFWIWKVEELYYLCSENKGDDQLRGYREADLRLCFCLCRLSVFQCGGSFYLFIINYSVLSHIAPIIKILNFTTLKTCNFALSELRRIVS